MQRLFQDAQQAAKQSTLWVWELQSLSCLRLYVPALAHRPMGYLRYWEMRTKWHSKSASLSVTSLECRLDHQGYLRSKDYKCGLGPYGEHAVPQYEYGRGPLSDPA